jgi:hypothetical protein
VADLVGYGASLVGVLFVVLVLPLAALGVWLLPVHQPEAAAVQWRRCNRCSRRWRAVEGSDAAGWRVRLRRRARRTARRRGRPTPPWAAARGWARCPSCLSRDVRPSRITGDVDVAVKDPFAVGG